MNKERVAGQKRLPRDALHSNIKIRKLITVMNVNARHKDSVFSFLFSNPIFCGMDAAV
jgi:hypothetical protein